MLSVRDLTKKYGDHAALNGVSFEVEKGDILGFLGANGAGKSTTMKIITGFIPATSGTAVIDGLDVRTHSIDVRRRIGYLPENTPLYPEMRVREYLDFRARLKGVGRRDVAKRVDYALERCWLEDRKKDLIGTLSKGYRQRVGIADALVGDPRLLILDEPTIGLDPTQVRQVRELIKELGQQHTVIFSTHILTEVEMVCSKVVIIARGRSVVPVTTVKGLVDRFQKHTVRVSVRAPGVSSAEIRRALETVPGVKRVTAGSARSDANDSPDTASFRADIDTSAAEPELAMAEAAERLSGRVHEKGWGLRELLPEKTTLEEVFVRIAMREDPETPEAEPELVGAGATGNGAASDGSAPTGEVLK